MGRKPVEINPEMGKRLSEWLDDVKITQSELADRVGYTQQYISNIVTGKKNLSVELARLISEKVPKPFFNVYGAEIGVDHVRPQWLLCLDSAKTDDDWAEEIEDRREFVFNCEWTVLDEAARKHGLKIILNHPYPKTPSYLEQIKSQKKQCKYVIQKDGSAVKEFTVIEFIKLTQQLEKYANYLIWEQTGGSDNG